MENKFQIWKPYSVDTFLYFPIKKKCDKSVIKTPFPESGPYVNSEHKRLAVNVSVMQGTSEISSQRHLCVSDHMVTLRIPWVKHNCRITFQISQWKRGDCNTCPTTTVKLTVNVPPSVIARFFFLSHKIRPQHLQRVLTFKSRNKNK